MCFIKRASAVGAILTTLVVWYGLCDYPFWMISHVRSRCRLIMSATRLEYTGNHASNYPVYSWCNVPSSCMRLGIEMKVDRGDFMTRDPVIFGMVAGFVGNGVKELIVWPLHWMGYIRYTFVHICAGYFVPKEFIEVPKSLAIGVIGDWTLAALFGVGLLQLIRRTGGEYSVIKGISLSAVVYLFLYGALMALDVTRASLLTPLPNLLLFIPHGALGAVSGWFIGRYDRRQIDERAHEKAPL